MNPKIKNILEKLLVPLLISGAIFGVFYFGGDAYKSFGVAAVDSTTKVLKYILGVIAFLSLGVLFNRIIRYVIFEGIVATATGAPVPKLLTQISSLLIFIVTVAACASVVFNQDLTILWAASGVAGLVLGMALRELLQDVFAGIALNIDRSVRIGDFVQIHRAGDDKILGQLMEVSWRSTHVKDNFGDLISFPNSKFSAYTITNFSASDSSGRTISVTIDGRVPTERAMRILQAAALDALIEVSGPNTALPTVGIKVIKNDGIEYIVSFEVAWELLADATWQIQQSVMRHLARAGLKPAGHKAGDDPAADSGFVAPDEQRLIALIGATRIFSHLGPDELAILTKNSTLRFVQPVRQATNFILLLRVFCAPRGIGRPPGVPHCQRCFAPAIFLMPQRRCWERFIGVRFARGHRPCSARYPARVCMNCLIRVQRPSSALLVILRNAMADRWMKKN